MTQVGPGADVDATPLWSGWELWCDFPQRQHGGHRSRGGASPSAAPVFNWLDTVKSVGIFDTAEGFWGLHDCVLPPSKLPNGANYYLFRKNIPPMWEHEANRRGGKWTVTYEPEKAADVDDGWTTLCLSAIGENVPGDETELCGIVVSKRKAGYRVSVWTRNATDATAQTKIGFMLKSQLNLGDTPIAYTAHGQSLEAPRQPPTPKPRGGSAAPLLEADDDDKTATTGRGSTETGASPPDVTPTKLSTADADAPGASPDDVQRTPVTAAKHVSPLGAATPAAVGLPMYTL